MNKIPEFKKQIDLETMGFYELLKSHKCPVSGLYPNKVLASGSLANRGANRQQIVGDFFHSLMDFVSKDTTRELLTSESHKIIRNLVEKYKSYFSLNSTEKIEEWAEISTAMKHALSKQKFSSTLSNSFKEKLLTSNDGRFKGKPDLYIIEKNKALVVDYKSSSIFLNNRPKDDYVMQLEFYSMLIFDKHVDVQMCECKLQGLKGEEHVFIIKRDVDYLNVKAKFQGMYDSIASELGKGNRTKFSEEACIYCPYKVLCETFYDNQSKLLKVDDVFVLKGEFQRLDPGNNCNYIVLATGKIRVPSTYDCSGLEIGKYYYVSDLLKRQDGLMLTKYSEFYES